MNHALQMHAVTKTYGTGEAAVTALRQVSIGPARGSFTAVMGPSGSGKSTFPHCAALRRERVGSSSRRTT
jgi:putative ABC transport system ATP-binding protein